MQNLIMVYEENRRRIETFLKASLHNQNIDFLVKEEAERLMKIFSFLDLVYATDMNLIQKTPNFYKGIEDKTVIGEDKSVLLEVTGTDQNHPTTSPYISTITGNLVVTLMIQKEAQYQFFDFSVKELLVYLGLLERHKLFNVFSRFSYFMMGGGLIFIALFSIGYGFYQFYIDMMAFNKHFDFETIFKPVIAITLALAFFDLGKTVIRHEVFPKSESLEVFDAKSFITFLTSIMIALLIEALLSVFKISLDGYEKMPYAAMLIAALSMLFFVFAWFIKNVGSWSKGKDKLDCDGILQDKMKSSGP